MSFVSTEKWQVGVDTICGSIFENDPSERQSMINNKPNEYYYL